MSQFVKWLFPGLKVKRWILLIIFGMTLFFSSLAIILGIRLLGTIEDLVISLFTLFNSGLLPIGIFGLITGIALMIIGTGKVTKSITSVLLPEKEDHLVEILFQKRLLKKGPRVVAIGGGSGLSTVLRGMKEYTSNITAVVTVADDGGSSGRLRKDLGILPPGDIRNCIISLADRESLLEKLFRYRFETGELEGHSFGNLFIAAMTGVIGDFEEAVKESSNVLAIRGRVIPSTLQNITLSCVFQDGEKVTGESKIPTIGKPIDRIMIEPENPPATAEVIEAIKNADIIIIGPGSLYTSIIPNLLIPDIADELRTSKGLKCYIVNTMTQWGETTGYSASDHVKAIEKHCGKGLFEYVILNSQLGSQELLEKYKSEGSTMVECDINKIIAMGYKVIAQDLIQKEKELKHNSQQLAFLLMKLIINYRLNN